MDSSFAQRLNYAMEQAGMNQAALAERTGASKAAISQYLHGKNIPGLDRMKALADATGVSFTYLMGNSAEVKKEIAIRKISIRAAARCLGKSEQFIKVGLQRGLLPFGTAVPGTGKRWNYLIVPAKFREYIGPDQFDAFFDLVP